MASFSRNVRVAWDGGLLDGKGVASAGSGAFALPVTFAVRVGEPQGHTSPEELIAAAHAACYAMAFNATLGRRGGKSSHIDVTATVTAEKSDSGIKIVSSKLDLVVAGLEGLEASQLGEVAKQAEAGCPVSNALRGNLAIDLDARVA